jgi:hypothetical protein
MKPIQAIAVRILLWSAAFSSWQSHAAAAALSASPASVPSGGSATVSWSGIAGPTTTDWIGLYVPGAADTGYVRDPGNPDPNSNGVWLYTSSCTRTAGGSGNASGSCAFTIPAGVAAGPYEFRLFAANGYTKLAASNELAVASVPLEGEVINDDFFVTVPYTSNWNARLPKLVTDGMWSYMAFTSYDPSVVSRRVTRIYEKRSDWSAWAFAGRELTGVHQHPGLALDLNGRAHLAFVCEANQQCTSGASAGSARRFFNLIFGGRNGDRSLDFGGAYANANEWTGTASGYISVGASPARPETYVSLDVYASDPPAGGTSNQLLFTVGGLPSTRISVPRSASTTTKALYPQIAFAPDGTLYYSVSEIVYPYANVAQYSDVALYRLSGTTLVKVFSDRVPDPDGVARWIYASDMTVGVDGTLYFVYFKHPTANGHCSYLVTVGPDGAVSAPRGVGCRSNYVQAQADTGGALYLVQQQGLTVVVSKSVDQGRTWTDIRYSPLHLPDGTTGLSDVTLVKPWSSVGGYDPNVLYGFFAGVDARGSSSYARTFTIKLSETVTLLGTPSAVPAGGTIRAHWSLAGRPPSADDSVALYRLGDSDSAAVSRQSTKGWSSGFLSFAAPATLGTYEFRLFSDGGEERLATSNAVTVTASPSVTAAPAAVTAGSSATVSWSGIATPSPTDWIGLYTIGAADVAFKAWVYVNCSRTAGAAVASGQCAVAIPANLPGGTYEFRLFAANGYTRLATSNAMTVTATASAALTANPALIAPGGSVSVAWGGVSSPTTTDWVGLYAAGASDTSYIRNPDGTGVWFYTSSSSCDRTAGSGAKASGDCAFLIPSTVSPGTYELRLFRNNGYTKLATSNALTLTSASGGTSASQPDLLLMAVSGPTSGTRGSTISVTTTVKNQGTADLASTIEVGVYLSTDATITTADARIGTYALSSLAAGASATKTKSYTVPTSLSARTYTLGAIADFKSVLPESSETNNAKAGNAIAVQ